MALNRGESGEVGSRYGPLVGGYAAASFDNWGEWRRALNDQLVSGHGNTSFWDRFYMAFYDEDLMEFRGRPSRGEPRYPRAPIVDSRPYLSDRDVYAYGIPRVSDGYRSKPPVIRYEPDKPKFRDEFLNCRFQERNYVKPPKDKVLVEEEEVEEEDPYGQREPVERVYEARRPRARSASPTRQPRPRPQPAYRRPPSPPVERRRYVYDDYDNAPRRSRPREFSPPRQRQISPPRLREISPPRRRYYVDDTPDRYDYREDRYPVSRNGYSRY